MNEQNIRQQCIKNARYFTLKCAVIDPSEIVTARMKSATAVLLISCLASGRVAPEKKNLQEKVKNSIIENNLQLRHAQVTLLYVLHGPCVMLLQESASVERFQEII